MQGRFDGDEMNAHLSQSIQTMCELQDFASVPFHIITPKDGKPVVNVVQDTMLGSYRISKNTVRIHDKVMANLQMVNSYFNGKLDDPFEKKSREYTGRQAFSFILPPGLHIKTKNKDDKDKDVIIKNSKLMDGGVVDKDVFHNMSTGIVPVIFHDYGPFEVRRYLDNLQRLICRWLMTSGFSVGISDLVLDQGTAHKLKNTIISMKQKAHTEMEEMRKGVLRNTSIMNNHDYFERKIINILNESTKTVGKAGRDTIDDRTNRMINMVKAGSKGKPDNVAQMIACVGQQNVDGKRVAYGFTDRTLPHYTKFDDGPEARGYVENSFISGLTPQEVFFHAMGGREGLIDTAVKSVTGDTPIVVLENGKPRYVHIGDWIDKYMETYPMDIVVEDDRPDLEFLSIKDKVQVYIPTGDGNGDVTWGELTAVTRHDPTEYVYEIETSGGRKVTVADSESLLVWDDVEQKYLKRHSSLVQEGDLVPVTMNLPESPNVLEYIDMSEYFPKTEYVYGTEFNTCVKLMKEAQGDKFHIPRGWYENNNGKTFTLPYVSKARIQRVLVRSNTENILDGCIYPYHATREHSHFPDKFALDYDNGVFMGLYLADGCFHETSGTISIAKEDPSVQKFIQNWFDKYGITHRIDVSQKQRGISTSVIGSSTLFARFINLMMGHGARNKHIPDIAYVAPIEFVRGLLSGYISGDGHIDRGGIVVSSVSRRLIEGIQFLCTRLGVFGKISTTQQKSNNLGTLDIAPVHHLSIRAQWAQKCASTLNLVHDQKNASMKTMKTTDQHRNFNEMKDTVMDPIVKITKKKASDVCTKMYDVTVPSTLNFGISNGIICQDTSETGYIQRRLVKAMEDEKIYYDNTVRNAAGSIIQFMYGEDGIEGTKIEKHYLPCIEMSMIDLDNAYHLRKSDALEVHMYPETFKSLRADANWDTRCEEHFHRIVNQRDYIIQNVFKGERETSIRYPIAFDRILRTASERMKMAGLDTLPSDLTPGYILDVIDTLQKELCIAGPTQGTLYAKFLVETNLAPKPLIFKHHMKKDIFDWMVEEIRRSFKEAIAPAGEMVGIIAAQSLGEPCTQLSNRGDTSVRIISGKEMEKNSHTGKIRDFIDQLLKEHANDVMDLGNDSTALYLKDDYYIIGVSNNEKTSWRRILEVSRHPANGGMVTVKTRSGRKTTATLSHSFLKRTKEGKIVPIEGANLKLGDRIPVTRFIPTIDNPLRAYKVNDDWYALDKDFGWIIGAYLADGCASSSTVKISKTDPVFENRLREFANMHDFTLSIRTKYAKANFQDERYADKFYEGKDMTIGGKGSSALAQWFIQNFKTGSYDKRIPAWVYASNREFIAGIVSGYFDGDGNVNVEKQMIRCHSVNEGLIEDISLLLNYCGVFATKLIERRKRDTASLFHVLSVSKKYAQTYKDVIGFNMEHKANNLDEIIAYNNREDIHNVQEQVDQIPECAESIAYIAQRLHLPGQSRTYKRWLKKKSIGRRTLEKYVALFKAANDLAGNLPDVNAHIKILEQAVNSNIVWDEIVELEYLPDPKEYVYDFTVPGNDSFMVDNGVLVHNTLDSFHASGTAAAVKATSGVPRLKELLSVSRNIKTPSLQIYLKRDIGTVANPMDFDDDTGNGDPNIHAAKERALKILHQLEITRLQDLLEHTEIFWDPPGASGYETRIPDDKGMLEMYKEFNDNMDTESASTLSSWVLRMKINREKLFSSRLTMMDIYLKIHDAYGHLGECVFADDNAKNLILRIRLDKKAMKEPIEEDSIAALKALEQSLVQQVLLKGTEKIKKVSMRRRNVQTYDAVHKKFDNISEWVLDTDGSNLVAILANPNVDKTRTISNDVYEIFNVLGIEAARNALENEIMEVIKESSVNFRHLSLLLDTMTHKGNLMSIDRHGINRGDVGPLAKSSFEETTDMLINASIFSDYDKINGVSANIMLGQLPPCGTGDSEILLDEALFTRLMKEYKNKQIHEVDRNMDTGINHENEYENENDPCSSQCLAIPIHELPTRHVPRKWLNLIDTTF